MSRKGWTADMHKDLAADLYDIRNVMLKTLRHPLRATEGDRLAKALNQVDAVRSTLEDRALKEGYEEVAEHYYAKQGHPGEKEALSAQILDGHVEDIRTWCRADEASLRKWLRQVLDLDNMNEVQMRHRFESYIVEEEDHEDNTTQEVLDEEARQEVLDDEAKEIEQDIINEEEGK